MDNFNDLLLVISGHGVIISYFFIFLIMCIEGPIIITLSSFAASLGYLDLWVILVLGFLGGIIPDIILYLIGRFARNKTIERIIYKFDLTKKRMLWLEKNIKNNPAKSLTLIKTIPPLPIPGLILTGFTKMKFKKFVIISCMINVAGTIFFAFIGFYSGLLTINILKTIRLTELLIPLFVGIAFGVYFFSRYLMRHISQLFKMI